MADINSESDNILMGKVKNSALYDVHYKTKLIAMHAQSKIDNCIFSVIIASSLATMLVLE